MGRILKTRSICWEHYCSNKPFKVFKYRSSMLEMDEHTELNLNAHRPFKLPLLEHSKLFLTLGGNSLLLTSRHEKDWLKYPRLVALSDIGTRHYAVFCTTRITVGLRSCTMAKTHTLMNGRSVARLFRRYGYGWTLYCTNNLLLIQANILASMRTRKRWHLR